LRCSTFLSPQQSPPPPPSSSCHTCSLLFPRQSFQKSFALPGSARAKDFDRSSFSLSIFSINIFSGLVKVHAQLCRFYFLILRFYFFPCPVNSLLMRLVRYGLITLLPRVSTALDTSHEFQPELKFFFRCECVVLIMVLVTLLCNSCEGPREDLFTGRSSAAASPGPRISPGEFPGYFF